MTRLNIGRLGWSTEWQSVSKRLSVGINFSKRTGGMTDAAAFVGDLSVKQSAPPKGRIHSGRSPAGLCHGKGAGERPHSLILPSLCRGQSACGARIS